MHDLVAVILAAGKGTRMQSALVKVLHPVAGVPMVRYPVRAARAVGAGRVIVVVGHQRERVEAALQQESVECVCQQQQLGTGHAVAETGSLLRGFQGDVLILCGDVPLIRTRTLEHFLARHRDAGAVVSVLSVELADPSGYGRIVRDVGGNFTRIVEDRDADPAQKEIREINSGIYCCSAPFLFGALSRLTTDNDQGEYYLPDIVALGVADGQVVQAPVTRDFAEVRGINDRADLAGVESLMRDRILARHMTAGVTIRDPGTTCIEEDAQIGPDTTVHPGVVIRGATRIGRGCTIEAGCVLSGAHLGNDVHLRPCCVIDDAVVRAGATVGPFAHVRSGTVVAEDARVGNFVETARTHVGRGAQVCHLSYLGDADVGEEVTVGAGTITCNFDGTSKHRTVVDSRAFVGSNTALVAPVHIGAGARIGAGSTITADVPAGATAIARSRQVVREPGQSPDSEDT